MKMANQSNPKKFDPGSHLVEPVYTDLSFLEATGSEASDKTDPFATMMSLSPTKSEPPSEDPRFAKLPGYELHGEIAHGGMGAVLRARDVKLGRELAVKVLLEHLRDRHEMIHRFVEEAQIGGQLQHPGIVPVYELGQTSEGRPYFTMKLIRGQTLSQLLKERTNPSQDLPRFLRIFDQICQTLAYVHARRVIHRDLKPLNIMVGSFGEVQVMDWGLAKVLKRDGTESQAEETATEIRTARESGSATEAGSVLGTLAYMAPEQARGEVDRLDERCDVFGLGALLCEILTGQPPYLGPNEEVFRLTREGNLGDAFARLDGCGADAELIGLARACLAAERAERLLHADALAEQLTGYLASVQERLRASEVERA